MPAKDPRDKRGGPPLPADIRAYMAADDLLQKEINSALEDLADGLADGGDLRVASLLVRTLEPSWTAHVSFQEYVIFPIVDRRKSLARSAIERLKADHVALADRHAEVREGLEALHDGSDRRETVGYLLRSAFEYRGRHLDAEAELNAGLPRLFAPADLALLDAWIAGRPRPPFPFNVFHEHRR